MAHLASAVFDIRTLQDHLNGRQELFHHWIKIINWIDSMQKPQNQDIDAAKHVEEDSVNVIEEGCVGKIPQP